MSRRKSPQADREKPKGAGGESAASRGAAGISPPAEKSAPGVLPLPSTKPTIRQKFFLAVSIVFLAAWLVFLVVLAILSRSKVKASAPAAGTVSYLGSPVVAAVPLPAPAGLVPVERRLDS